MNKSTEAIYVALDAKFPAIDRKEVPSGVMQCARAVYTRIAKHAGPDLTCWPSHKRLAEDTDFSERTVRRALVLLADYGYIHILEVGRDKKSTRYKWCNPENIESNLKKVIKKDSGKLPESTRERSIEDDLSDTSWA